MDNRSSRPSLMYKGHEIFMDTIKILLPEKKMVVVISHDYYADLAENRNDPLIKWGIAFTIKDNKEFNRFKFEYIKYIKTMPDPNDRVADFEYRTNGLIDFDKMERLIEMRKTREEKAKELDDEIEIKKACIKRGVEYWGYLR